MVEIATIVSDLQIKQARHDERIQDLEDWKCSQDEILKDINKKIEKITKSLDARPSWAVTIVLTILATICGSMTLYIITNMR